MISFFVFEIKLGGSRFFFPRNHAWGVPCVDCFSSRPGGPGVFLY